MLSRRPVLIVVVVVLCAALAATAHAAVPSAANSFVDPCLRICPAGDMNFHVVVRDAANNPVAFSTVTLNLCLCPGVVLCPPGPADPYTVSGCTVQWISNAAGIADLPLRAGGVCMDSILVFADGVLLAIRNAIASPDQDGNLTVNAVDTGIINAKLGGTDPTGDLNCSGLVDIGDPGILLAHGGHSCQAVVPVRPGSWGKVKIHYR